MCPSSGGGEGDRVGARVAAADAAAGSNRSVERNSWRNEFDGRASQRSLEIRCTRTRGPRRGHPGCASATSHGPARVTRLDGPAQPPDTGSAVDAHVAGRPGPDRSGPSVCTRGCRSPGSAGRGGVAHLHPLVVARASPGACSRARRSGSRAVPLPVFPPKRFQRMRLSVSMSKMRIERGPQLRRLEAGVGPQAHLHPAVVERCRGRRWPASTQGKVRSARVVVGHDAVTVMVWSVTRTAVARDEAVSVQVADLGLGDGDPVRLGNALAAVAAGCSSRSPRRRSSGPSP